MSTDKKTFDQVLPVVQKNLKSHTTALKDAGSLWVNLDLNGRVRLIAADSVRGLKSEVTLQKIAAELTKELGVHAYPADQALLFDDDPVAGASSFALEGVDNVHVIDRQAAECDWSHVTQETKGAHRVVFFSIKGGVGRSTALAVAAWKLAEAGKKVLVLDLDLESPGLSSALLPEDRRPKFGIIDWLVEDLVDNGPVVLADMVATSTLSREGDIWVVPAHGQDPGAYISKLGRVWMPKVSAGGVREAWSARLSRLIGELEKKIGPDVILIDSRAGIDEVASGCVMGLGAKLVLLFAVNGEQTWTGYRLLFEHWNRHDVAPEIRERLQIIGAMVPDDERRPEYMRDLCDRSYDLFLDTLYDSIEPGKPVENEWTFSAEDVTAAHFPLEVRWNRGFSSIYSLNDRLQTIDKTQAELVFGPLLLFLEQTVMEDASHD